MGSMNHELQFLRGNHFPEDLEHSEDPALRKERQISRKILVFASTVAVMGIVCLVIGIALLRMNRSDKTNSTLSPDDNSDLECEGRSIVTPKTRNFTDSCSYSTEFKTSGTWKLPPYLFQAVKPARTKMRNSYSPPTIKAGWVTSTVNDYFMSNWLDVLQFK